MKVLIVGGGGREHALAWKCAQSARVSEVLVAPGNAGTELEPRVRNVAVASGDIQALVALARKEAVALTIVGPEAPLVAGIVDAFHEAGLRCFGPTRLAAQLEGSKAFSKNFLQRHRIPTAAFRCFTRNNFDPQWLYAQRAPIVVKASGLAAGKGVIIAETLEAADTAARGMFAGRFGGAGSEIVIEEFLQGEEASFIVMANGTQALALASSQDHKRLLDGDVGPNTGGMGAYSPAPVIDARAHERVMQEIIAPTLRGLAQDGTPYVGFLYAGLMIGADGAPRVLEFNCRLGDPETQPIMARLHSDLTLLCEATLDGRLADVEARWDARSALGVVITADGYPENSRSGDVIHGLEAASQHAGKLFHGSTHREHGELRSGGGRVLCAVGLGEQIGDARRAAYSLVECIRFDGMHFRRDIGYRAIQRAQSGAP